MNLNSLGKLFAMGLLVVSSSSIAQQTKTLKSDFQAPYTQNKSVPNEYGIIRCHTMERDSIRRAENPNLPTFYEEQMWFNEQVEQYKKQQSLSKANGEAKATILTIPIIFHIITDGSGSENVSATQIQAQVDQLNIDYRNLAGSTHPAAGDAEIEFCLATVDEGGNVLAEPGINRITTYGQGPFSDNYIDATIKPNTIWDPDRYFNVWSANISGSILGYAQFPSNSTLSGLGTNNGPASTDGVVVLYSSIGSLSQPFPGVSGQYNKGRTLSHEAGHWLGLIHIWGDWDCSADDFCTDTPNCSQDFYASAPSCNNPSQCGNTRMIENYMDYSDDGCMDIFTAQQVTRMRTALTVGTRRALLPSSTVCGIASVSDDAGISAIVNPSGNTCGSGVTPVVTLTNNGSNDIISVTINYNIDGVNTQTQPWSGTLAPGASVDVTLPTMTTTSGPHTFNAYTSNPNGTTDGNTGNDASNSSFTMTVGGELITITIDTDCYGEETVWELYDGNSNLIASDGNQNVTLPVTATQSTSTTDPGALANETTIIETFCLDVDCYEFIIWDAYGDGMYGSQYTDCNTNGFYEITDDGGNVLASMQATNSNFLFSETASFCVDPPCASTFETPQTITDQCYGDNSNQITVNFLTGNSTGATYDIGTGATTNNVFSNLSPGNYTITVVDGASCTTVLGVTVTGPAQLNASVSKNNVSCNGLSDGQITVNATGGTSPYTYYVGGNSSLSPTFTGLAASSYTISVTDYNGCTVNGSNTNISEPSALTTSVGAINPELAGNDGSVNLNVSGGTTPYSYNWSGPNSYTSGVQDPANMAGGTYSVTVTDGNGCTSTINGIVVPSQLGIDEFGNTIFSIYPNPSNGVFNVSFAEGTENASIQVMDIAGRIVYTNENVNGQVSIDMSNYANGNYMLAVGLNGATHVKRVTLKK